MASIFQRSNKDGTFSWRVQIRRKGLKSFSTCFSTKEEAIEFVKQCEENYCLDPQNFSFNRLQQIRKNEFSRKRNENSNQY